MSGLGDMGNLLKQAQEMQKQIDRVRSELRRKIVEGRAGAGVVVRVSADREEVEGVDIDPHVVQSTRPEDLAELVKSALQDALRRARDTEREAIGKITGGMNLPGLF